MQRINRLDHELQESVAKLASWVEHRDRISSSWSAQWWLQRGTSSTRLISGDGLHACLTAGRAVIHTLLSGIAKFRGTHRKYILMHTQREWWWHDAFCWMCEEYTVTKMKKQTKKKHTPKSAKIWEDIL